MYYVGIISATIRRFSFEVLSLFYDLSKGILFEKI